jgi:hypothetical protein
VVCSFFSIAEMHAYSMMVPIIEIYGLMIRYELCMCINTIEDWLLNY